MTYEDTMKEVLSGRVKVDKQEFGLVDQGHGTGIGHIGGSYESYVRQLHKTKRRKWCHTYR